MIKSRDAKKGEIHITRMQGIISRLAARVDMAVWEYRSSYKALLSLGVDHRKMEPLQLLDDSHLSGLSSILAGKRELEEGYKRLPWFWQLNDSSGPGVQDDEYNAGK